MYIVIHVIVFGFAWISLVSISEAGMSKQKIKPGDEFLTDGFSGKAVCG